MMHAKVLFSILINWNENNKDNLMYLLHNKSIMTVCYSFDNGTAGRTMQTEIELNNKTSFE